MMKIKTTLKLLSLCLIISVSCGFLLPPLAEDRRVSAQILPQYELALHPNLSQAEPEPEPDPLDTSHEAYTELSERRTAGSKTYLLESKRYETVLFGLPVHYEKDGSFQPIDNRLSLATTAAGDTVYRNQANTFRASFATELGSGPLATLSQDGFSLSWTIEGLSDGVTAVSRSGLSGSQWSDQTPGEQRRSVANLSSEVRYRDVLAGVDLDLQLISDHVKENIVLRQKVPLDELSQTLTTQGLTLELQPDRSILALDGETVVFFLPAPYAYDATGENILDLPVSLTETTAEPGGKTRTYTLTFALDLEWLAEAVYPVTIDPTVLTSLNTSDIKDTRVVENYPSSNYYGLEFVSTGRGSSSGTNYTLIRFENLPGIGSSSMVQYSGLRLHKKGTSSVTSHVSVHQITSNWTSSTVTWNSKPSFNSAVEDWQQIGLSANVSYEWDITRIAKHWYTGGTNYGVLLKDMSSTGGYKEFYSADAVYFPQYVPYAYFVYTNYSGLEGSWDYLSSGQGRSGTAHVNLYNGNLVYTHGDVAMTGNRLPIAVTHVWNSTTRDSNETKMLYGKGWRTNYDQRVSPVTISGVSYYQYTDEDGTIHYFRLLGSEWKDESGLDLKLTVSSFVVTITDKQGNYLVFHPTNSSSKPGFLNYIEDRNGNRQTIGYDANSRIYQVTDAVGRIVKFNRDANGYLIQIGEPTSSGVWRYTSFAYTSARLTSITYPDSEVTTIAYDASGNISAVTRNTDYADGSGTNKTSLNKLELTYTSGVPNRVTGLYETGTVSGVTTEGAHAHLSYGYNRTTIEDSEGRQALYQFNDFGNTVCVTGPDGGAAYAGYGTSPTAGSMSKVVTASKLQKFGRNLLQNHSLEQDANWTFFNGSGSVGTHTYATDQAYLGARSIRLYKENSSGFESAYQSQSLIKGKTYTISCFVKTENVSASAAGASFYASYTNSAGVWQVSRSPYLVGSNDWTRLSVTFTLPEDSTSVSVFVQLILNDSTGTAWFDCLQLEEGSVANRYNIVENADFSFVSGGVPNTWTRVGDSGDNVLTSADSSNPVTQDDNRYRCYGAPGVTKTLTQNLALNGLAGDSYVAGGWAKATSVPLTSGRTFAVSVFFDYTDPAKTDEWQDLSFSPDSQVWQYVCQAAVARYNYQAMKIRVTYTSNANSAEFDAIQLFREDYGATYVYDDNGNLIKVTDVTNTPETVVNQLGNSNAEEDVGWEFFSYSGSTGSHDYAGDQAFKAARSLKLVKTNTTEFEAARQTLSLVKGQTYTFSGWIKTSSVSSSSRGVHLAAVYYNASGNQETVRSTFLTGTNDWQRYSLTFTVPSDASTSTVYLHCLIYYSTGTVWFDCIQLEEGSGLSEYVQKESISQFLYNTSNDLTQYIDRSGRSFTYTYDARHNILTATSATGIVYTYTYDTNGNQTSAKVGGTSNNIRATVSYSGSGSYTDVVTDPFGKQVDYAFDSYKGTLSSVVDPLGNTVSNTYDAQTDALTQTTQTSGGVTMTNSYTYLDDRLTNVAHTSASGSLSYAFSSNCLGWTSSVKVAGAANNLVSYTLQARTGRLEALTYGNGDVLNYSYDAFDKLEQVSYGATPLYRYAYNNSGNVGYHSDLVQNKQYWYDYDSLERLGKITRKDASGVLTWSQYTFNKDNALSVFREWLGGLTYETGYSYDDDDRPTAVSFGTFSRNWSYDAQGLSRVTGLTIRDGANTLYSTQLGYAPGDGSVSIDSSRVSSINNGGEVLTYSYDDRGFITQVYKDANNYTQYRYDGFGQLKRENYKWAGTAYTKLFHYDVGGNITAKVTYAFVDGDGAVGTALETIGYGYTDSVWKDKLTSFNGNTITYDEIGNPLSDGTWTYTWTQGRKLQQITDGTTTASYKYNESGIRTEKTVNGVTTVYNVIGGNVTWEKTGSSNPIYYSYDASGSLWAMQYNGSMYFTVRNAQGDVIKLVDSSGAVVVEYAYDAWGKLMGITGSLASTLGVDNPYRYRGYRYDNETGLYYLQSRYYDPDWGRFINADGQLNHTEGFTGVNLFQYCGNNPVNSADPSGKAWLHWAIAALVVVGCAIAVVATAGGALPAILAVAAVASGGTALTVGSTVAAAAFVGASAALGTAAYLASSTSSSLNDFADQGNWGTVAATAGGAIISAASAAASTWSSSKSSMSTGKPFDPEGPKVQIGVDPKTLTPTKDLTTLDPVRLKNVEIFGRDQALSVYRNGVIEDGHHRLANALANNRAVDIVIFP
jgi:RHS repeat-associated protein